MLVQLLTLCSVLRTCFSKFYNFARKTVQGQHSCTQGWPAILYLKRGLLKRNIGQCILSSQTHVSNLHVHLVSTLSQPLRLHYFLLTAFKLLKPLAFRVPLCMYLYWLQGLLVRNRVRLNRTQKWNRSNYLLGSGSTLMVVWSKALPLTVGIHSAISGFEFHLRYVRKLPETWG